MILDHFLESDAKAASLSKEEYIEKKVVKGKGEPNKKEIEKFIKDRSIPKDKLTDDIRGRIKDYLRENKKRELLKAYLAKKTSKKPVKIHFQKPKPPVVDIAVGDAPVMGPKNAKVTIIEFSDFECPFCARAAKTVDEVKKKYKGKVRVAFKNYPLDFHPNAKKAAEAALCAGDQGKFWQYHDTLFDNQRKLTIPDLESFAKAKKLDMGKFNECLSSNKYAQLVANDMKEGEKVGVRATPTFFINGRLLSGARPLEDFVEVIDEELEK